MVLRGWSDRAIRTYRQGLGTLHAPGIGPLTRESLGCTPGEWGAGRTVRRSMGVVHRRLHRHGGKLHASVPISVNQQRRSSSNVNSLAALAHSVKVTCRVSHVCVESNLPQNNSAVSVLAA